MADQYWSHLQFIIALLSEATLFKVWLLYTLLARGASSVDTARNHLLGYLRKHNPDPLPTSQVWRFEKIKI